MRKQLFYEIEFLKNDPLIDIEKTFFSILSELDLDIFEINFQINVILTKLLSVTKEKMNIEVYLGISILQVIMSNKTQKDVFNIKHTKELDEVNIEKLKSKVASSSNFFALHSMKNQDELEKMLEERVAQLNKKLHNSAYYDELTSLPNRSSFFKKLDEVISLAQRRKTHFSLMFLDLDGFKYINDYYGHDAGDIVLQVVAKKVKAVLREYDFFARLGGDEFVVLLKAYENEQSLGIVAQKIISSIEEDIYTGGDTRVQVSVSIGIAVFPKDGNTKEDILKYSDISMYEVKKNGKGNFLFFNETLKQDFQYKKEIEKDLNGALQRGEFFLLYQPKMDIEKNVLIGVEALLRWNHPQNGIMPNFRWIPIMENSKCQYEIGLYVLDEASRCIEEFNVEHNVNISLSVNADIKDILSPEYLDALKNLNESRRKNLTVELLERDAVEHFDVMLQRTAEFKKLGVKLSFDDFGTGSTSLSYLSQISPDELKIDRSFVANIDKSKNKYIVQAIMSMAKGFDISVIAEGVETKEELEILRSMGCKKVQGYYFSKPITLEELAKFGLNEKNGGPKP